MAIKETRDGAGAAKFFQGIPMRQTIEYVFEAIEANIGYALFAGVASFAMTGCLRLLWE